MRKGNKIEEKLVPRTGGKRKKMARSSKRERKKEKNKEIRKQNSGVQRVSELLCWLLRAN